MLEQPLVSIIIPTFNRANLIGETLDSVLVQTYQNWECLVVDDGSTDGTDALMAEYLAKDSRFHYHKRPDTHLPGGNGARNYGFEISKGEYVNWLDSDDLFHPKKLKLQVSNLVDRSFIANICLGEFFDVKNGDSADRLWSEWKVTEKGVFDALITQKMRWPTGAVLWKRDVLPKNCWNENLSGGQEWLFHCLLALDIPSFKFGALEEVLFYIRSSNDSITRQQDVLKRYSSYLDARIYLLQYLEANNKELFTYYFSFTFNFSLKYIKPLILNNRLDQLHTFGLLIYKISILKYVNYYIGILVYRLFGKTYFLKKLTKG